MKKVEKQKYLGLAKTVKNEIDEMLAKAEKLSGEVATGQIKIDIDALTDMEGDEEMDADAIFNGTSSSFVEDGEDDPELEETEE